MRWTEQPLESLCLHATSGGTPATSDPSLYDGDIPWLRTQEVNFNFITDTEITITEAGLEKSAAKWIPENSVIVALYGNSAGRVAVNKIPLTTNQACGNFIINPEKADYRFVYYSLLKDYEILHGMSKGAAQNNLNLAMVKQYKLRTPDLPVQQRIGGMLVAYDDLIENNRRRMALLEETARLLYREWFVRLRFPGHENTHIVDGVPEGWKDCPIRDFGEVITGKTPSTKESDNYGGEIPFIKTPDMHDNVFVIQTETNITDKGANTQSGKFIPPDTLLVSCIGTIGVVSITSARSQFNQQINAVMPFDEAYRYYCFFAFKNLKGGMEAIGGGATMGNVNKTKFEGLCVLKPSIFLLREFHDVCTPMFQQIQALSCQKIKLRAARDLLLPRLMRGDLTS